ncbi:MAG: heavy metal translocating P-type ATPase metal-binding domain-containing protein [Gammaproteobacteria bacterium]
MNENKRACDLCGLDVDIEGFRLRTKEGIKEFCCEGCKGIYQMLHEDSVLNGSGAADETD